MACRNLSLFYWVALWAIALDRLSKYLMLRLLSGEFSSLRVFRYFSLTLVKNTGICFGMLSGFNVRIIVIIASFIIGLMIVLYLYRCPEKSMNTKIALGLIEGGIAGNLIDRIATGAVIDFINFHFWPVFNLADVFIVSGIALVFLQHMRRKNVSGVS
ncbi:MAG: signal peptidase II [Candidatus Omnitrophica bacterium]|nr:signal peptidase II [Candidatus Omnitrophota bacterium]